MIKTVIDIQLWVPEKENKVMVGGVDYSHTRRLLLDIAGGKPARVVTYPRKPSLRKRIAMWIFGSGG